MKKLSLLPRSPWWALNEIQVLTVLVLSVLFLYLGALTIRTYREADIIGKPQPYLNSISVIGKGVVRATPNIARVSAGLETTATTVDEAQKIQTEKMNAFIQKIRSLGIAEQDSQTTSYSISPKYEDQQETKKTQGKEVMVGYTANQTMEIKVRNFQNLGAILAAVGQSGLNHIGSLQFDVDDETGIKKQALARAIHDAQEKATILGQTSGARLGRLTAFYENQDYSQPYSAGGEGLSINSNQTPTPLPQPGIQEITVSVTLSYEIK